MQEEPPKTDGPAASEEPPEKEPVDGEVTLVKFAVRELEGGSSHTYFAWTVKVANRTDKPKRLTSWLYLYDKDRFLLDDAMGDAITIPAGATTVISDKSLTKTELWKQVDTYRCVIK